MITGLAMVTANMDETKINGLLLDVLFGACYFQYNTAKPYLSQVEAHMELLKEILPNLAPMPKGIRLFEK